MLYTSILIISRSFPVYTSVRGAVALLATPPESLECIPSPGSEKQEAEAVGRAPGGILVPREVLRTTAGRRLEAF